ncbi:MAG: hypothetical protein ACI4HZ_09055, partial [Ruminococcus sp.]
MKIKIKQTFRSMWATILAVLMLLSTFSAVAVTLNKEDTGANVDIESSGYNISNGTFYFIKPSGWGNARLAIGGNPSSNKWRQMYAPSYNIDNKLYAFTGITWNNYESFFFIDVSWSCSSESGDYTSWHGESSNVTNYITGDTSNYLYKVTTGNSGAISAYSNPNVNVSAKVYVKNGDTFTENSSVATASVSGKKADNNSSSSQVGRYTKATFTTSQTDSSYEFVGWYDSTNSSLVSNELTYVNSEVSSDTELHAVYELNQTPAVSSITASAMPDNCYVGQEITLGYTAEGAVNGTTYSYDYSTDNSNWTTIPDNANTFTPDSAGTYYFRVKASADGYDDVTSSNETKVTVSLKDVATNLTVTTDKESCETHDTITLGHTQDSVEADATFVYAYTKSASPTDSDWTTIPDNANTFTPTSAGTYYFRVTASKDGFATVTSEKRSVEVTLKDVVSNLTVSADKTKAHTNEAITLSYDTTDANPPSGMTVQYQYKKGADGTWENTDSTFTPTEVGKYYYRVTLSKDTYNSVTSTNEVSTDVTDVVDVATVTLTPSNANPVNGDTVTYTATISDLAGSATYTMTVDGTTVKSGTAENGTVTYDYKFTDTSKHTVVITVTPDDAYNYREVSSTVEKTATSPKTFKINGRFRIKDESGNESKIGWKDYNATDSDFSFTYAGDGKYKFETGCTVKELSEKINQGGNDYQYFFIRDISGNTTYYVDHTAQNYLNETAKMAMGTSTSNSNSSRFNGTDESGKVTLWIDTSTSGSVYFWYTIPEAVKYPIEKIGTNTDKFDTKVNSVSVTEASAGANVTIEINPEAGYEVATVQVVQIGDGEVEGDTVLVSGDGNSRTFTMPESKVTVNVTFKLKDYTMTGNADPSTFNSYVKCYDTTDTEISTATKGQTVKFVATAVSGYSVSSWTVTGVADGKYTVNGNTVTVEVGTEDVTATANYVGDYFNIVKNSPSKGSYTVTGTGVVDNTAQCGSTVTITPSPEAGYELDSITVKRSDGQTVTVTDNSFTMPAYHVTITVKFRTAPVDKGTLQANYRVLYSTTQAPSTMKNVLSNSEVYLKDGVYTAYISGTDLDKLKAINGQFFVCISSDSTYQNMLCKGDTNPTNPTTETSDYVNSVYRQDY